MAPTLEDRKKISRQASELMQGQSSLTQARAFIEQSIKADPQDARLNYQLGTCLERMARELAGVKRHALLEDSAAAYQKASDMDVYDFKAAHMAACVNLGLKKPAAALPYAQRAVSLQPNDSGAHYNLGRAYEGTGENSKAIASYQAATQRESRVLDAARLRIKALRAPALSA